MRKKYKCEKWKWIIFSFSILRLNNVYFFYLGRGVFREGGGANGQMPLPPDWSTSGLLTENYKLRGRYEGKKAERMSKIFDKKGRRKNDIFYIYRVECYCQKYRFFHVLKTYLKAIKKSIWWANTHFILSQLAICVISLCDAHM